MAPKSVSEMRMHSPLSHDEDSSIVDIYRCGVCQHVTDLVSDPVDCDMCGEEDSMRRAPAKIRERLMRGRG